MLCLSSGQSDIVYGMESSFRKNVALLKKDVQGKKVSFLLLNVVVSTCNIRTMGSHLVTMRHVSLRISQRGKDGRAER